MKWWKNSSLAVDNQAPELKGDDDELHDRYFVPLNDSEILQEDKNQDDDEFEVNEEGNWKVLPEEDKQSSNDMD